MGLEISNIQALELGIFLAFILIILERCGLINLDSFETDNEIDGSMASGCTDPHNLIRERSES